MSFAETQSLSYPSSAITINESNELFTNCLVLFRNTNGQKQKLVLSDFLLSS